VTRTNPASSTGLILDVVTGYWVNVGIFNGLIHGLLPSGLT